MIEVKNPRNGIRIKIAEQAITQERIDDIKAVVDWRIASLLDSQKLNPVDWFRAYVDICGPMSGGAAWFAERKLDNEQSNT